jgi:3-oxoacyl-[acyl-carrier protein] reductase
MDLALENQVVLITGANGGIGMAIAQAFLKEKSQVACFVRGGDERMSELRSWMEQEKISLSQLICLDVDIGNSASLTQGVEQLITKFKKINVLVNNAGSAVEVPFMMMEDEEWNSTVEINFNVMARLTRKVCRQMLRQKGGSVVNVSSVVSLALGRGVSAYASAKAATNRLTEILAVELGRKGIRVNAVAPGAIETKMSRALMARAGDQVIERTPLKRMGRPEEVAQAVLFLASETTGSFITGHILKVDGGVSL